MSTFRLTKSTYLCGVQCIKRLYLKVNSKRLGIETAAPAGAHASRLDMGTRIGKLAQDYFPGGFDCSFLRPIEALSATASVIDAGEHDTIYEASFQFNNVFIALDILVRKDDGWHAYEVKSTGTIKKEHYDDIALQYWVISGSGLKLQSMNIMYVDKSFVLKGGPICPKAFFLTEDVTKIVEEFNIATSVEEQLSVLDIEEVPSVCIGPQCSKPHPCEFKNHCWEQAGVPEYSVLDLANSSAKRWNLFYDGIKDIRDIPLQSTSLSPNQRMQVETEKSGLPVIKEKLIHEFISSVSYPIYYLDFETLAPAVPLFSKSRPYQAIPFQYSLHVQEMPLSDGGEATVYHREFIGNGTSLDPRPLLLNKLFADIGETGSVLVYNKSFEDSRLKEMSLDFPEYKEAIEHIRCRLVDLALPFQKKYCYTPEMRGKYSIKQVLPALCPDYADSYKELDIQEGLAASDTYMGMVLNSFEGDREKSKNDLLKYCELDTFAMVKLLEYLCQLVCRDVRIIRSFDDDKNITPKTLEEEF